MSTAASCGACGSPLSAIERICVSTQGTRHTYRRCASCASFTLFPLPDRETITSFYPPDSYGVGEGKFPGIMESLRDRSGRAAATLVHGELDGPTPRILDIGCGSGAFLRHLADLGCEIFGTELPGPACERARRVPGIHLWEGDLDASAFADGHFDAITLWHVLEHLAEPVHVLEYCRAWLKPGGLLFVEVPNAGSWQAGLFGRHWLHLDPPRHLHQFTPQGLEQLLQRSGFRTQPVRSMAWAMGVFGFLQSAQNPLLAPRDLFYNLLLTRGRIRVSVVKKVVAWLLALVLGPVALFFAACEGWAGHTAAQRIRAD